jgi:GAF domain-containing protein
MARLFASRSHPAAILQKRRRLRVLHALRLLDTAHEPFLDAVVDSAATIANTPIAALSLIDAERQWFKASLGMGVRETPLDVSFCRHALDDARPLIVPDTRLDLRFAETGAVKGDLHVRFYAGFPLVIGGMAIGALCVVDDHPRRLLARQCERLAELAAGAVAWIETHAAKAR